MLLPLDTTEDYQLGYVTAQKVANVNPYLDKQAVKNVAMLRLREIRQVLVVNAAQYVKGFQAGYHDELLGIATPIERSMSHADSTQDRSNTSIERAW